MPNILRVCYIVVLFLLVVHLAPAQHTPSSIPPDSDENGLPDRLHDEITELISKEYWQTLPADTVINRLQREGLRGFDPYSRWFPPSEWEEMKVSIAGRFGGIGVIVSKDTTTGEVVAEGVLLHSPADAAGIMEGDVLVEADGIPLATRSLEEVIGVLRGGVGEPILITVARSSSEKTLHLSLVRDLIRMPSVRGWSRDRVGRWNYLIDGPERIAYLRITQFTEATAVEVDSALAAIDRSGARGLILDLRDNTGGLLKAAVGVADLLLDTGTVVTIRGRLRTDSSYTSTRGARCDLPMAMLINGQTASSGEILASALQDNRRTVVIGSRSYGKGLIQRLFGLADSVSGIMLTTAAYIRPSGRPIERHLTGADTSAGGIWPDSGMQISDIGDTAGEEHARLLDADQRASFAHVEIRGIGPKEDRAIEQACLFLTGRLRKRE